MARVTLDRVGAVASGICAVHCLLTGAALGVLSVVGLGFLGSVTSDIVFIGVTVTIASAAIVNGIRSHGSYRPLALFVLGLALIVAGHTVYRHEHAVPHEGLTPADIAGTTFSVCGGLSLVGFHLMNMACLRRATSRPARQS